MSGDVSPSQPGMIITDDVAPNPILDFEAYSNTIVKMITESHPKFSIGIYGEWGTGKTTLMKVIENKLNKIGEESVVDWDDLLQNKGQISRFKDFLRDKYKADWIDNSEFKSENDRTLSLLDNNEEKIDVGKGTYDYKSKHSLTLELNGKKDKASLTMDENIIRDFVVKKENNILKLHLQRNEILTVWFNAWRYEREEQFAIIALVKTIGYAMSKHPIYKELKPILLNAVKIIGKGFLSEIAAKYIGEKGVEEFKTQLLPKMEFLSELDKDTIYFDAINRIEIEMRKILDENPSTRVVVFIDDLDRCSPKKALEVFESIKVFLGLDGFVYVVGLSHVTIGKLITAEYEKSKIKGEDYIKKIIQIPIILPEWNTQDVESLINHLIQNNLINKKYKDVIQENLQLISQVVQNNPRDVKRFINNYIVAFEIHSSNKKIDLKQLLLLQVLNVQWSTFYQILVSCTPKDMVEIFEYADMDEDERTTQLESDKLKEGFTKEVKFKLQQFKSEYDLWKFLKHNTYTLLKIENWDDYRRASESAKELSVLDSWYLSDLERGRGRREILLIRLLRKHLQGLQYKLRHIPPEMMKEKEVEEKVKSILFMIEGSNSKFDRLVQAGSMFSLEMTQIKAETMSQSHKILSELEFIASMDGRIAAYFDNEIRYLKADIERWKERIEDLSKDLDTFVRGVDKQVEDVEEAFGIEED